MQTEIIWVGNMLDDCKAEWRGLFLHAEQMDRNYWWWRVSGPGGEEIDSSNNHHDRKYKNGKQARKAAEEIANEYFPN